MNTVLKVLFAIPLISLAFSDVHNVSIIGGSPGFDPSQLTIDVYDSVMWTNNTNTNFHSVEGDGWGSDGNISSGDTFYQLFNSAGVFPYICGVHASTMSGTINVSALGIENSFTQIKSFNLNPVFPNPFNPKTSIEYSLLENADVELIIYNIQGKKIHTLVNDFRIAGDYSINWDASPYPSGMYFARMVADEYSSIQKLMLIK